MDAEFFRMQKVMISRRYLHQATLLSGFGEWQDSGSFRDPKAPTTYCGISSLASSRNSEEGGKRLIMDFLLSLM